MKQLITFASFIMVLLGLPSKSFAQLENKTIYIYNRGDEFYMEFYCTDKNNGGDEYSVKIYPEQKGTKGYWKKTRYEGVYRFEFITYGDGNGIIQIINDRQIWYFYESLNIFTQISPSDFDSKRSEIIDDPWMYGHKAEYEEQYRQRIKQLVERNKHLFTQTELNDIGILYHRKISINEIRKRQEIYNLINQHPEVFSLDFYYEILTWVPTEKLEEIINRYYRLWGEWESDNGTVCSITTTQDNKMLLTLKNKRGEIFKDYITGKNGKSVRNVDVNSKRGKGNEVERSVYSNIFADEIHINITYKEERLAKIKPEEQFENQYVTTKYYLSYKKGYFILEVTKDGKEAKKIVFRKKESTNNE